MINAYQTRSRNIPHDLVSFCRALQKGINDYGGKGRDNE